MVLEINKLTKEYVRLGQAIQAVNHVDLSVEQGGFVCIVGHSGCGKSTLFNMISGLIKPTSGSIAVSGQEVTAMKEEALAQYRNQTIGYVLQGQSLLSNFNILDNVCMPLYLDRTKEVSRERAIELLEMVGLKGMEKERPPNLSGGELRRVSIVRSVINHPKIIIADEPTNNLDPQNTKMIMEFFKEINKQDTTVIISTHNMDCLSYAKKIYTMEQGNLV